MFFFQHKLFCFSLCSAVDHPVLFLQFVHDDLVIFFTFGWISIEIDLKFFHHHSDNGWVVRRHLTPYEPPFFRRTSIHFYPMIGWRKDMQHRSFSCIRICHRRLSIRWLLEFPVFYWIRYVFALRISIFVSRKFSVRWIVGNPPDKFQWPKWFGFIQGYVSDKEEK